VGMSGGIDSSVAALLLREQGYAVIGVTLKLWTDVATSKEHSCCSPESAERARQVARKLGIPHFTLDVSELFYDQVVRYFVEGYRDGLTPNPCAKCNTRVKFRVMAGLGDRLGLAWVATGHYARMIGEPRTLTRALHRSKDQSYVLAEVDPHLLRRTLFPLGRMAKHQVQQLAADTTLDTHQAKESQEICFVADDDHRRFLRERLGELPGTIVDVRGRLLGHHTGTYNFTIGQRKGLGLVSPAPLYVLRIDAAAREVVVGTVSESAVKCVSVGDLTHHRPSSGQDLQLQIRSSGQALKASLCPYNIHGQDLKELSTLTFVLDEPEQAVAPGQTAVVYEGKQVVVAGTIMHTFPQCRA
jgi:tRNA-specific 2-thiouridylase